MTNKYIINRGGILRYAKNEYEYLFHQSNSGLLTVMKCFMSDELFRVNVYINWLQQPKKRLRKRIIKNRLETKYRCVVSINARIGCHFHTYSAEGIVIGDGVIIGDRCHTYGRVTFGQKNGRFPCIGSDVVIGENVVIIGSVYIGNHVVIENKSVVMRDVPEGVTVGGIPASILRT